MQLGDVVTIYVNLLDEGTPTMRPAQAVYMGEGLFKLLPTDDYDPEDETWEFLPDSIVHVEEAKGHFSGKVWLAVK